MAEKYLSFFETTIKETLLNTYILRLKSTYIHKHIQKLLTTSSLTSVMQALPHDPHYAKLTNSFESHLFKCTTIDITQISLPSFMVITQSLLNLFGNEYPKVIFYIGDTLLIQSICLYQKVL